MKRLRLAPLALLFLLVSFASAVRAQSEAWPALYDPFRVRTIYLQMESSGWSAVVNDNDFDDPQDAQLWTDGETPIPVRVKRKSDPAIGQKVSVKIDINARVPGQEWHGVEKLSLENGAEGGLVKEGLAWNMHRLASEAGFYSYPAAYAAWVRLVVDGQLIGTYSSVEERDDQMLKNKGLWKEGVTWLYKYDPNPVQEEGDGDSPALEHLCYSPFKRRNACAQPADLEADLQAWIDMQGMLTLAAIETFTGNPDGLFTHDGKNNFAADFVPPTELKRLYFPWDLDAGLSDVNFPILGSAGAYQTQILGHPWFRQCFLHILGDLLDGPLSAAALTDFLNRLEPVLTPALLEDANGSVEGDPAAHFESLRQWITNRIANVRTQIGPIMGPPRLEPAPGEFIPGLQLTLSHTNSGGTIYYTLNGADPRGSGGAIAGTAYAGPLTLTHTTHMMARVHAGTNWSALRQGTYNVAGHAAAVKITEIMYQPKAPSTNQGAGQYEFLELQNRSGVPVDLSGCYFTGIDFRFRPGTAIGPSHFVVLVRNAAAFTSRYPGVMYHGIYRGGLDKAGEKIRLKNSDGNNIFSVEYDDEPPWPLGPNGFGWSLVNLRPQGDPDNPEHWRASASVHGSPGANDPEPPYGLGLVINEVLTHTVVQSGAGVSPAADPPQEDAIELHNPTGSPVDLSGWFLSNQMDNNDPTGALLKKFRIPPGTIIPAGGFKVFYEVAFNPDPGSPSRFALSEFGDAVYLASADAAGDLTGYIVGAKFGAADRGVSFGGYPTSARADFTALQEVTLGVTNPATLAEFRAGTGAPNSRPCVGPVVISEIMYNPAAGGTEFVELHNLTDTNINLDGWTLEGASFVFPSSAGIGPKGCLVLVGTTNITAEQFRASNHVPALVPILMHRFDLKNEGEALELKKPNPTPMTPAIVVDRVRYNDKAPWPTEADGEGPSLERFAVSDYGNDPLNWRTAKAGGTPGAPGVFTTGIAIARNSAWRYNASGSNLGTAWRSVSYSDSGWPSADGALGYGHPFINTVLPFGRDPTNKIITTYFRKEFVINDAPATITNLALGVNYNDGFVAYLNGQEVVRRSMPPGAVEAGTLALPHAGGAYEPVELTAHRSILLNGANMLAVEVHLESPGDADLVWDAELTYAVSAQASVPPFRITTVRIEPGPGLALEWESIPGRRYRLQVSADLISWDNVEPVLTATATTTRFNDVSLANRRFYRVALVE